MVDTHPCKAPISDDRQSEPELNCPACGGQLSVIVHLYPTELGNVITYLRCENCEQIKIIEEPVEQYRLTRRFLIQ